MSVPIPRRRKEARPAELLEAALDLFQEKGFAATRMEDIAARAGVSKGTVYLYFPSKEAVFEGLVRTSLLPNIEVLETAVAAHAGTTADLLRMMVTVLGGIIADRRRVAIPKLVIAEAGNFPHLARFYRREVIARGLALISGVFRRGMERGEFRTQDPELTARLFMAPFLMSAIWQTTFAPVEDNPADPAAVLSLHVETFLRGLAPEEGT